MDKLKCKNCGNEFIRFYGQFVSCPGCVDEAKFSDGLKPCSTCGVLFKPKRWVYVKCPKCWFAGKTGYHRTDERPCGLQSCGTDACVGGMANVCGVQ